MERDKTQSTELLGLFICVHTALCTIVARNTAQNRPDNFPSYPPDNHHSFDDVYLREGEHSIVTSNGLIIIIRTFVTRAVSANILNLRRRQSLGEEDGGSEV